MAVPDPAYPLNSSVRFISTPTIDRVLSVKPGPLGATKPASPAFSRKRLF
jgi:hypothetical protein